jgi:hypothetical protein
MSSSQCKTPVRNNHDRSNQETSHEIAGSSEIDVESDKKNADIALKFLTSSDPAQATLLNTLEEDDRLRISNNNNDNNDKQHMSPPSPPSKRPPITEHRRVTPAKLNHVVRELSNRRSQSQNSAAEASPGGNQQYGSNDDRKQMQHPVRSSGNTRSSSIRESALLSSLAESLRSLEPVNGSNHDMNQNKNGPTNTSAQGILSSLQGGRHRRQRTVTDTLYAHARHLENLFREDLPKMPPNNEHPAPPGSPAFSDLSDNDIRDDPDQDDVEGGSGVRRPLLGRRQPTGQPSSFPKFLRLQWQQFLTVVGPWEIWNGIRHFFWYRFLLCMVPLLSLSAILFYCFQQPNSLEFLPSNATLSWWLIFVVRLLVTYSLAEVSQYALEVVSTHTTIIVRVAGPFLALVAMQSLGWPFLIASWSTWTTLLMKGKADFVKHWFYFLNIGMFSSIDNPDDGILESVVFERILLAMVLVGVTTAAKRTVVALYLSRRMLRHYRKHLCEVLADIKVVMEVAELAAETENEEFSKLMEDASNKNSAEWTMDGGSSKSPKPMASHRQSSALKLVPTLSPMSPEAYLQREFSTDEDDTSSSFLMSDDLPANPLEQSHPPTSNRNLIRSPNASVCVTEASQKVPIPWSDLKNQASSKVESSMSAIERAPSTATIQRARRPKTSLKGFEKLVPQLDTWDEPETKVAKASV